MRVSRHGRPPSAFEESRPTRESLWRSVVLFGRNVATYKFALAKSLLEVASAEKTLVTLEELAEPFSRHVAEHLRSVDKQATSPSSTFLDACRRFNRGELSAEALQEETVRRGFVNVIDAFHVVNQAEIPLRFFTDERGTRKGITVTDDLLRLKEGSQFGNLPAEVEARWRLVETAWSLGLAPRLIEVQHDSASGGLFVRDSGLRRIDITSARDALNGYQKGKCFYCFADVSVETGSDRLADIDHFFPWTLYQAGMPDEVNLDGVWNLVLSCSTCNRGAAGKFARIPEAPLLERLHTRNSYLIRSHHPLRETLIRQTGASEAERRSFLQRIDDLAVQHLIHRWAPAHTNEPAF